MSEGIKKLETLTSISLFLKKNKLELNSDNIKYLAEGLKPLKNLEIMEIELDSNNLGGNSKNLRFLGPGLNKNTLQTLKLSFNHCSLGGDPLHLKLIESGLRGLTQLKVLKLDLNRNLFGSIVASKDSF